MHRRGATLFLLVHAATAFVQQGIQKPSVIVPRSSTPIGAITTLSGEWHFNQVLDETANEGTFAVIELSRAECTACKGARQWLEWMSDGWPREVSAFELTIESCESKALFKSLGVQSVPHIIIARGEVVESFYCSPKELAKKVGEKLAVHGGGLDLDWRPRRRAWRRFRRWWTLWPPRLVRGWFGYRGRRQR
jgi:hypothetical protein